MTNKLEKTFFDIFEIEPKEEKYCYWECKKPELENVACNNTECEHYKHKIHYPQITDHILLELICIKNKELISIVQVKGKNLEELKSYILQMCIKGYTKYSSSSLPEYRELADNFKHQVRTLFEEVK